MPDGDRVGSAYVDIHVNAAPGEAELAAFKAKVDRDFDELGRKKAEASLSLKKLDFDKDIAEAKTQLDYFKKRRAEATLDLAKKHFDEQVAAAEAELKALTSKKRTIQLDSRQVKEAHKAERLLAKEHALTERAALQTAKAERALATERDKAVTRTYKERAELAKLGQAYEKLRGQQIGLEKSSRRVFSSNSIGTADKEARRLEKVASEADYVKHKIEKLGGSVEDLDPQIQRNHTLWGKWLGRLGDTSIRIGPITTSVKGLGTGLALLGPLVFELGGGLTALAGTVGEGLVGAFTVGAGAIAGLATSAAGVGFVIGPMIGEFKEVASASEALHKAELKYGKGSEQVKTAQERLNNELRGVSPIAREAFESLGGLKDKWKSLTKEARPAVFDAMGESIKTAQDLLPAFASESVKTTQVASKAWSGWMKSLRSSESKNLLKSIMGDFRASIPGLAEGLGSLVAMMGRVSAAGAYFLPGLSNGFADWANNLERAVGGGDQLQSSVGGMVDQMRDLGHLTQDTGSLLVHIFDAGADSGQGMVKSLDQVIKRWDKWTQSSEGKAGLKDFFGDSKAATEDFMSSLSHLTRLLFEFSRATAPVANGLLQIVTWIGDLVSAADDLVGVKTVFQGLGLALAGLWITGKAMAFASSIQTVTRALYGLAAGEEAVAAAQASGGFASLLTGRGRKATTVATTGEEAAVSARQLALFGGAAGTAEAATVGLEGSAGLLAAALAPEVLIPAAAVAGLVGLAMVLSKDERSMADVQAEFRKAGATISHAMDESATHIDKYVAAQHNAAQASHGAADARARLVKLQHEGASADKVTRAVEDLADAEQRQAAVSHQTGTINRQQVQDQRQLVSGLKSRISSSREMVKAASEYLRSEKQAAKEGHFGANSIKRAEEEKNLALGRKDLAKATRDLARAEKQEAVTSIPYQRHLEELKPISQEAEQGLRKLVNTIGASAAKKVGKFVDPKDVQRVTELGNKLSNLGRGGQVKDIAVKSQGADQTIGKLRQLQKQTNKVESSRATIKVGANDQQAQSKLKRLSALSQRVTGSRNTIKILANSSSAENAIQRLRQNLVQVAHRKYEARLDAIDNTRNARDGAYHHLREVASKKYEARISAIDNASSVAKKAGKAADDAGRKKPKIQITATNSQALASVRATEAAINAISSNVHPAPVIVPVTFKATNSVPSGRFAGGPAAYTAPFAMGGPSADALQRAADNAVFVPGGTSRKVNKPTMLTGEEGPNHPEYVIATNPAYRDSNERYLKDAAGDLGYEVVPAYAGGKGKKKKGGGGGSGGGDDGKPGKKPGKGLRKAHYYIQHDTFEPKGVREINTAEKQLELLEDEYTARLNREEHEITAKRLKDWSFDWFEAKLQAEQGINSNINHELIPRVMQAANFEKRSASKTLKGPASIKNVKGAEKEAAAAAKDYSNMKAPTKSKGESDGEYKAKQKAYNKAKKEKKAQVTAKENRARKLKTERKNAQKIYNEANEEIAELKHQQKLTVIANEEIGTELLNMEDIESGVIEKPYAESSSGGDNKPTLGEQTATSNAAREQLFNQFASNILGFAGAAAGTHAPGPIGVGGGPGSYGVGSAAQTAATTGPGGYVTSAAGGGAAARTNAVGGASGGAKTGTVNNVTNNFAAPPPDPHTWTRGQQFELGALAG